MKKTTTILTACSLALCASSAMADNAATIFGYAGGTAVTYDGDGTFPVVTTILSVPGVTVNGKTYSATSGSFLAADPSGSLQIFGTPASTYTPTVGDAIAVNGTYSPYHQLPEIGSVTQVAVSGTLESPPIVQPQVVTVSQTDVPTLPQSIAGQLLQIDNATISGETVSTFGIANLTLTVTDSTGSQTLYYWPTSYSMANLNLYGQTIPTGPVDIIGIASVYTSGSSPEEFLPINIIPAPEPSSIALAAIGGVAVLMGLRRRK